MRLLSVRRFFLIALLGFVFAALASPASAQTGYVRISIVKGGWFIGAEGGGGELKFRNRIYPLSVGGLSAGLVFGGSATDFVGRALYLRHPADIQGVYTAVGAGIAVAGGPRIIEMRNARGVVLQLQGRQIGLMANLDLSGMTVSLR
jgi:hypothetical protein